MKLIEPFPIVQVTALGFGAELWYRRNPKQIYLSIRLLVWLGEFEWNL